MPDSTRTLRRQLAPLALAAACTVVPVHAAAEDWVNVAHDNFVTLAFDRESIAAVDGIPSMLGAWFRFRFASSVDCSPPRGCYASSQRSYYHVDCYSGMVRLVQRQFLDLNDNVLRSDDYLPWYYHPPRRSLESRGVSGACLHYRSLHPGWQFMPYPP